MGSRIGIGADMATGIEKVVGMGMRMRIGTRKGEGMRTAKGTSMEMEIQ